MEQILTYLALSGALTVLLWTPYILARVFVWGLPTFLNNYPANFPKEQPEPPLWAERAKRAHLNMVETMPAFIAVTVAAIFGLAGNNVALAGVGTWAGIFLAARLVYAVVYILGVPYLRTPPIWCPGRPFWSSPYRSLPTCNSELSVCTKRNRGWQHPRLL